MKIYLLLICFTFSNLLAKAETEITVNQDKPPRLFIKQYNESQHESYHKSGTDIYWYNTGDYAPWGWVYVIGTNIFNNSFSFDDVNNYQDDISGLFSQNYHEHDISYTLITGYNKDDVVNLTWPQCVWPNICGSETEVININSYYGSNQYTNNSTNTSTQYASIIQEHCDINVSGALTYVPSVSPSVGGLINESQTASRSAQATLKLQTGGKSISKLRNLFGLSGNSTQYFYQMDSYSSTPGWIVTSNTTIQSKNIIIGSYGSLNTNGTKYLILPDNSEVDLTPYVAGVDYYKYNIGQPQKYHSYFDEYVEEATPYNPTNNSLWPPTSIHGENDVGHAFYSLRTDAPGDALKYIGQGQYFWFTNDDFTAIPRFSYTNMTVFSGMQVGFYPSSNNVILTFPIPILVSGRLYALDPCKTPTIKRTFSIGFDDFINGLEFTKGEYFAPGDYTLLGRNCVEFTLEAFSAAGGDVFKELPFNDITPEWFGINLNLRYPGPQTNDATIYDSR
jgi:hypothetical protein